MINPSFFHKPPSSCGGELFVSTVIIIHRFPEKSTLFLNIYSSFLKVVEISRFHAGFLALYLCIFQNSIFKSMHF
jgi:hypothetical protein